MCMMQYFNMENITGVYRTIDYRSIVSLCMGAATLRESCNAMVPLYLYVTNIFKHALRNAYHLTGVPRSVLNQVNSWKNSPIRLRQGGI